MASPFNVAELSAVLIWGTILPSSGQFINMSVGKNCACVRVLKAIL